MHLREDNRIEEVTSLDVVKVAHHGSIGAFDVATWRLHARGDGTTSALLTPFSSAGLPHQSMLEGLREHVSRLGITANTAGAFGRAQAAGWTPHETSPAVLPGPVLAVVLGDSAPRFHSGHEASFFERTAPT
jgi:hypothetical protein